MTHNRLKKRNKFIKLICIPTILIVLFIGGGGLENSFLSNYIIDKTNDEWRSSLYTPTMIEKLGDLYFIADCWNHRFIYSDDLDKNISDWNTLTEDVIAGHSIASDGELYLVDDTERGAITVFCKNFDDSFQEIQQIDGIDGRPHYILYDEKRQVFYAISSVIDQFWTLKNNNGKIEVINKHFVKELLNESNYFTYVRSFSIIDDKLYCVSGPGKITIIDLIDFSVVEQIEVPKNMYGMNFITKIDDYFYITYYSDSSNKIAPGFVRTKDLKKLISKEYEDIYSLFGFEGTPYYITSFDDTYFVAEIDQVSGIKSFKVINNEITDIQNIYHFDEIKDASKKRKEWGFNLVK